MLHVASVCTPCCMLLGVVASVCTPLPTRTQQVPTLLDQQFWELCSLQCKRILGGRNHVRVRNIVVAAIFDFMAWKIGESRNSNPYGRCEGERRKGGRGRGENSLLSPRPLPAPFDSPHLLLSSGSFNMALLRANCALEQNACTAG